MSTSASFLATSTRSNPNSRGTRAGTSRAPQSAAEGDEGLEGSPALPSLDGRDSETKILRQSP